MADIGIKISEPISAVIESASTVVVAILNNDATRRETMSPAARDEQDKILAQIYWDWRGLLQFVGVLGPPK